MRRCDDDEDDEDTSMRPSIENARRVLPPPTQRANSAVEVGGGNEVWARGSPVESLTVSATRESKTLAEFDELARDREFEALNYLCAT